jgi:hypothetical protein
LTIGRIHCIKAWSIYTFALDLYAFELNDVPVGRLAFTAFGASAKHAGNVADGLSAADTGLSTCTNSRGVCEFMEHLAASRANGRDLRTVLSATRLSADMDSVATQTGIVGRRALLDFGWSPGEALIEPRRR